MARRSVFIAALLLVVIPLAAFASVPGYTNYHVPVTLEDMKPNGEYVVSVFKDGAWKEAASISCDRFFRERSVDLEPFAGSGETPVRVRIEQKGGGAAHVDAVLLGVLPPSEATCVDGDPDLGKLAKRDFDVVDAHGKRFDLLFPVSSTNRVLSLTARVESIDPGGSPFYFPLSNGYRPIDLRSDFITYTLEPARPSIPEQSRPFFREFCVPGSGHPSGYTYGWVWNDDEYLYVNIDLTPDNTLDGDKDYAEVYVKTEDAYTGFRVSVEETRWGQTEFTYTEAVPYQHKVYHFRIPLSAVGKTDGALSLAFSAYGTVALPEPPHVAVARPLPNAVPTLKWFGAVLLALLVMASGLRILRKLGKAR